MFWFRTEHLEARRFCIWMFILKNKTLAVFLGLILLYFISKRYSSVIEHTLDYVALLVICVDLNCSFSSKDTTSDFAAQLSRSVQIEAVHFKGNEPTSM